MKSKLKNHFIYNWTVYLAIAVLSVLIWNFAFKTLSEPKANERINIAIFCEAFDDKGFAEYAKSIVSNEKILQVNAVWMQTINEYVINTNLYVASQGEFDLIIIEKTLMPGNIGRQYFHPLDQEQMDSLLGPQTYYLEEGSAYGFLVPKKSELYDFVEEKPELVIFVSPETKNFMAINGKGSVDDKELINFLEKFLGERNAV